MWHSRFGFSLATVPSVGTLALFRRAFSTRGLGAASFSCGHRPPYARLTQAPHPCGLKARRSPAPGFWSSRAFGTRLKRPSRGGGTQLRVSEAAALWWMTPHHPLNWIHPHFHVCTRSKVESGTLPALTGEKRLEAASTFPTL